MLLAQLQVGGITLGDYAFALFAFLGLLALVLFIYYIVKKKIYTLAESLYRPTMKELTKLSRTEAANAATVAIKNNLREMKQKETTLLKAAALYNEAKGEEVNA